MRDFIPVVAAAVGAFVALLGVTFAQVNTARRERRSLLLEKYEQLYECVGTLITWGTEQAHIGTATALGKTNPTWAQETLERKNTAFPGDRLLMLARCYQSRLVSEAEELVSYAAKLDRALGAVSDQNEELFNSQELVDTALVKAVYEQKDALVAAAERFRGSIVNEVRRAL